MKKFIAGVFVGALLFGAVPVFADSLKNLVGAKVAGVYEVEKNGTKIADAAIIDGSAYVPVRPISEATGAKLTVEGKKIILETNTDTTVTASIPGDRPALEEYLKSSQAVADRYREVIAQTAADIAKSSDADEIAGLQKYLADVKGRLTSVESEIAKLQAQLK